MPIILCKRCRHVTHRSEHLDHMVRPLRVSVLSASTVLFRESTGGLTSERGTPSGAKFEFGTGSGMCPRARGRPSCLQPLASFVLRRPRPSLHLPWPAGETLVVLERLPVVASYASLPTFCLGGSLGSVYRSLNDSYVAIGCVCLGAYVGNIRGVLHQGTLPRPRAPAAAHACFFLVSVSCLR